MREERILFILKARDASNTYGYSSGLSTGLLNSATFVRDMLDSNGFTTKLVVVIDNNDIDREVAAFRPTHVIIEALWVVPSKFKILKKLHPTVKWIVRLHSEAPFLANEGIAIEWINKYVANGVTVGVNSLRFQKDLQQTLWWEYRKRVIYMPNYYPLGHMRTVHSERKIKLLKVGCFGAIRPLKNQLAQAMAAIQFANEIDVRLQFHVNSSRLELKGDNALKNLEALFLHSTGHRLIKHGWFDHPEFLDLVGEMDLCMQVSFSESFNIVAADCIASGVPTVMSKEIPWAKSGLAHPTDISGMVKALKAAWSCRRLNVFINQKALTNYSNRSERVWINRALWRDC
jgi:hypothetical protein